MVHPNAAAIDIGATMHMAAVRADRAPEPVRSFGTFTADLHRLVDWFTECGVETVVMESTSVYWIPIFELLDARGFAVFLVNARDAKHVPGRKTDVSDAQWLQRLHSFGLLRASFRPKGQIAELRAYVRQRERLLEYAASHIQHMQKALTEMNLQLHHVVADITGATGGLRIIRAILAGERDPEALAGLNAFVTNAPIRRSGRSSSAPCCRNRRTHRHCARRLLQKTLVPHRQGQGSHRNGRKIAVLFYNAVRHGMDYVDPGASSYEIRYRTRVINNLHRRAKAFGFVLQPLEPKAGAAVS